MEASVTECTIQEAFQGYRNQIDAPHRQMGA